MRTSFLAALALAAIFAAPGLARAESTTDQNTAVQLCRNEITTQSGISDDQLRLTQVRARLSSFRAHFTLWRSGQVTGVDCEVTRQNGSFQVASINPPLTATAASAEAGH